MQIIQQVMLRQNVRVADLGLGQLRLRQYPSALLQILYLYYHWYLYHL